MKPKIAVCAKSQIPLSDTWKIARNNGYVAVDWSIELDQLSSFKSDRLRFEGFANGDRPDQEIRYHCPLSQFEIAHVNHYIAQNSVKLVKKCIDALGVFKGEYLTLHIGGAGTIEALDWNAAVSNLSELVEYGKSKDVTVCLENLKSGWTSDPVLFSRLIDISGAAVTFDIGHANSSVYAMSGEADALDFLSKIGHLVVNAHIYEAEDPYHIAPQDLRVIEPILTALLKTQCRWWVVELDEMPLAEHTRALLEAFLRQKAAR